MNITTIRAVGYVFFTFGGMAIGGMVGAGLVDTHETPEGVLDCSYLEYAKFSHTVNPMHNMTGTPQSWYDLRDSLIEKGWQIDRNETTRHTIVAYCPIT